jgi:uncharacterized protein YbbC (DUF1343 family)
MIRTRSSLFALGLMVLVLAGSSCSRSAKTGSKKLGAAPVTGADQTEKYFPYLKGKRVAMMVNQTSIIGDKPSVDVMLASGIKIVKIFGPEHGFRGNASNGAVVADEIDPATGVPIISLYGKKNKPTADDMKDVDVLIYDMQDTGVRFYTNINALRRLMETCAEYDKEMLLLDRPNPHAYMIDGPILDMRLKSGIGQFPIPIAHGMTTGEFAQMINGEGWLEGPAAGKQCKLKIIPIANYTHDTPYVLPVNPSPNLNTPQSIMLYPSTCLFEGTKLNHGRGTMMPFTVMGSPTLKGKYEFSYTPTSLPGMSENPLYKDQVCYGLDLRNVDTEQLRKSRRINLSWMKELYAAYPEKEKFFDSSFHPQIGNIDKLSGVYEFRKQIQSGMSEEDIRKTWEPGLATYRKMRKKYLLYP